VNYAIINGLIAGCVYALVAYGYHLTWITTRTVNFGQGTLLMVGGMTAYILRSSGASYPIAVICAVVVGAVAGALTERLAINPLAGQLSHSWVLSTFGVGIMLQGAAAKIWGYNTLEVPSALAGKVVTIAGANITQQDVLAVAWCAATVLLIALTLRWTMLGKAIRAVAANRRAAALVGISPGRIAILSYALSSLVTAGLGAILAGSNGVAPDTGIVLGFSAFFAAMLGGIDSGLGVVFGGLAVGLFGSVIGYYQPLMADSAVLLLIAVALVVRPFGLAGRVPVERV
jgi:branched-chain amino acid transport system permease protein